MDNWTSILSILSFCISCFALFLNWKNSRINEKKYNSEQEEKNKANLIWDDVSTSKNRNGKRKIRISNTGYSDAKDIKIFINGLEIQTYKSGDRIQNGMVYRYHFEGIKIVQDNFPTRISAKYSEDVEIMIHVPGKSSIEIKLVWTDDYEEKREKIISYLPGTTKIAN